MHIFHYGRGQKGMQGGSQMIPLPKELSKEFHILEPGQVRFQRDGSELQIWIGREEEGKEVSLVRLFPLSELEGWISVLDSEGREVGIIEDLKKLDSESRDLASEGLRRRYVVPQIRQILSCREKFEMIEWEVKTDRGMKKFLTRNLRDNIQEPRTDHLILTDVDGNRYDISDFQLLDSKSKSLLERYF